jgi:hypothetical protein
MEKVMYELLLRFIDCMNLETDQDENDVIDLVEEAKNICATYEKIYH